MPIKIKVDIFSMKDNNESHIKKTHERYFLFQLTLRSCIFLFLILLVLLLFYGAGNFQQFLDSTQHFILILSSAVSIALAMFSFALTIESVVYFIISKQKFYFIFLIIFIFITIISIALLFLLRSITFLSSGL